MLTKIKDFFKPGIQIEQLDNYLKTPVIFSSEALIANEYYFNNYEWAEEYLKYCHRSESFKTRWGAAIGNCADKIVVDIGCGPGNIFATLAETPKILIGIDVAANSLVMARQFKYIPVLADAQNLPFISEFADIVVLNATLHHCEDMKRTLQEAARLVKPGGFVVTDHDPQLSAWDYRGIAKLLWKARLIYYRIIGHGFHKSGNQQFAALASEIHHKPGSGVLAKFFKETLEPLNFKVDIFPHNHTLGSEVLDGQTGKAEFKYRIGNLLSGRNPNAKENALSLMCIAHKRDKQLTT